MSGVFIDCPVDGVFPYKLFDIGPNVSASFEFVSGNTAECPHCGQYVPIINGEYTYASGKVSARLTPTPAQMQRIKTALAWASEQAKNPDVDNAEVERKIRKTMEKEAPKLTSMVDKVASSASKGGSLVDWLALMVAIIALLTSANPPELTPEFVREVIEEVQKSGEGVDRLTPSDQPMPKDQPAPREVEDLRIVKT